MGAVDSRRLLYKHLVISKKGVSFRKMAYCLMCML